MPFPKFERIDNVPVLRPAIVAFVDLLGTSEFATGDNAQTTLASLDQSLAAARAQSMVDDSDGWSHASWFSDNLALAAPVDPDDPIDGEPALGFLLLTLMWLQFRLATEGFFTRGGLVIGDHFSDDSLTFGPALVEAVRAERLATYPRVIVMPSTLVLVNKCFAFHGADNPFIQELMTDQDGKVFISYLSASLEADDQNELVEMLELHRSAVQTAIDLHRHDSLPGVWDKYRWVGEYHNAFCTLYAPEPEPLLIPGMGQRSFTPYEPPPPV